MDVGRAAFNRVVDNLIDQLHRGLVVERELFGFFHSLGLVVVIIIFHRGVHVGEVFNRRRKLHIRNDQRANFKPGHQMQIVDGDNVVRVFHGDIQGFVLLIEGQNIVAQRHFGRNQVCSRNIDADFVNRNISITAFLRHGARNVIFGAVAELCQNTADERFAGFLNFQRFLRLRLCYNTGVNKPRTNTARVQHCVCHEYRTPRKLKNHFFENFIMVSCASFKPPCVIGIMWIPSIRINSWSVTMLSASFIMSV